MTINLLSIWIMSKTSINFLYVKVILKKEDLKSSGHSKPFDTHLYLKLFIMGIHLFHIRKQVNLTLSWRRPIQYRNQSIDLQSKSVDWFLYDIGLRHERVKKHFLKRGYTHQHSEKALLAVKNNQRDILLQTSQYHQKVEQYIFVFTYYPSIRIIPSILHINIRS